ncbi:MAG: YopX family protein [Candidatus Woesearchaeota archaeon]
MSREIKFRAWDGKMHYPEKKDKRGRKIFMYFDNIMQFTGLKDKNGKEIYEGDIIHVKNNFEDFVGVVMYEPCSFFVNNDGENIYMIYSGNDVEIEIIGNKFENPELLGEEDE